MNDLFENDGLTERERGFLATECSGYNTFEKLKHFVRNTGAFRDDRCKKRIARKIVRKLEVKRSKEFWERNQTLLAAMSDALARDIRDSMRRESFARKVLPVKVLP